MKAKDIVKSLGVYSEDGVYGKIEIPQLSVVYGHTIEKEEEGSVSQALPTEKQTRDHAAAMLQKELDDGNIVLSDTWFDDNITDVKDLTDKNDKQ